MTLGDDSRRLSAHQSGTFVGRDAVLVEHCLIDFTLDLLGVRRVPHQPLMLRVLHRSRLLRVHLRILHLPRGSPRLMSKTCWSTSQHALRTVLARRRLAAFRPSRRVWSRPNVGD